MKIQYLIQSLGTKERELFLKKNKEIIPEIEYMCLLEDDMILDNNFENFVEDNLFLLKEYNFLKLGKWGEGFITSIDGSKYILKQIYNDGIIFNIDDQLEICCKNHKYLPDTPFTLMIETNQGDCLKTKEISNNEILKLKSLTITSFLNMLGIRLKYF
jgi:hypothetical protein